MKPVEFHPEARADLSSASAFYRRQRQGLAAEFRRQIRDAVGLIQGRPGVGTPVRGAIRGWVVRRFPFRVIYREERVRIYVLAVAHERRRPGYWLDRN